MMYQLDGKTVMEVLAHVNSMELNTYEEAKLFVKTHTELKDMTVRDIIEQLESEIKAYEDVLPNLPMEVKSTIENSLKTAKRHHKRFKKAVAIIAIKGKNK